MWDIWDKFVRDKFGVSPADLLLVTFTLCGALVGVEIDICAGVSTAVVVLAGMMAVITGVGTLRPWVGAEPISVM